MISILVSGLFLFPLIELVNYVTPAYKPWLTDRISPSSSLNILTKLYNVIPIIFLLMMPIKIKSLDDIETRLLGIGLVSSLLFLGQLHAHALARLSQYFILISIIPQYFVLRLVKPNVVAYFLVLYFLLGYAFKLYVFPSNEYIYQSIVFQ